MTEELADQKPGRWTPDSWEMDTDFLGDSEKEEASGPEAEGLAMQAKKKNKCLGRRPRTWPWGPTVPVRHGVDGETVRRRGEKGTASPRPSRKLGPVGFRV
jgi:hypothetical protein